MADLVAITADLRTTLASLNTAIGQVSDDLPAITAAIELLEQLFESSQRLLWIGLEGNGWSQQQRARVQEALRTAGKPDMAVEAFGAD